MSQISKALYATDTGKRFAPRGLSPIFRDVLDESVTGLSHHIQDLTPSSSVYSCYKLQLKLGINFMVGDADISHSKHDVVSASILNAKRNMVEAIFGEFRPQLTRIRMAIENYDTVEATRLLNELEEQMFSIED
jgi:hypothetical protein